MKRAGPAALLLAVVGCSADGPSRQDAASSTRAPEAEPQPVSTVTAGDAGVRGRTEALSYYGGDPAPSSMGACVVMSPGNPMTRADREAIQGTFDEWTVDSALDFDWATRAMQPVTVGGTTYQTNCAFTLDAAGVPTFVEHLRAYMDETGNYPPSAARLPARRTVPGCLSDEPVGTQRMDGATPPRPVQDAAGNFLPNLPLWGAYPNQQNPRCLYSAHLFPGQPRNNYLHEAGHVLGWRHEHDRSDASCGRGSATDTNRVTVYDVNSVMHYVRTNAVDGCTAPGNWGNGGLTPLDYFGAEMMFPERLAAIPWGPLGFVETESTQLITAWEDRGALVDIDPGRSSMRNFLWRVDGWPISTSSAATIAGLTPGVYSLSVEFDDMWGRRHADTFPLEVVTANVRATRTVATAAVSAVWM